MENSTQFEVGKIYQMRFITDSALKIQWECISRTARRATFRRIGSSEQITRKVNTYDDYEYVNYSSYSMAPSMNSDSLVQ